MWRKEAGFSETGIAEIEPISVEQIFLAVKLHLSLFLTQPLARYCCIPVLNNFAHKLVSRFMKTLHLYFDMPHDLCYSLTKYFIPNPCGSYPSVRDVWSLPQKEDHYH